MNCTDIVRDELRWISRCGRSSREFRYWFISRTTIVEIAPWNLLKVLFIESQDLKNILVKTSFIAVMFFKEIVNANQSTLYLHGFPPLKI